MPPSIQLSLSTHPLHQTTLPPTPECTPTTILFQSPPPLAKKNANQTKNATNTKNTSPQLPPAPVILRNPSDQPTTPSPSSTLSALFTLTVSPPPPLQPLQPLQSLAPQPFTRPTAHRKHLTKALRAFQKARSSREHYLAMAGRPTAWTTCPPQRTSFTDRVAHLNALRQQPQHEQRSAAWYAARDQRITASEFGKLLKTTNARTNYAIDKAERILHPLTLEQRQRRPSGKACVHGIRFEPVCDLVYRTVCRPGVVTEEFGMLVSSDPSLSFLGASPDGICTDASAFPESFTTRLVEYKSPYSRPIVHGRIKDEYLAQMQGQMAVIDVDECDFLECALKEVSREVAMEGMEQIQMAKEDTLSLSLSSSSSSSSSSSNIRHRQPASSDHRPHPTSNTSHQHVGAFLEFPTQYPHPTVFGAVDHVDDTSVMALLDTLPSDHAREMANLCYWKMDDYQLVTVYRNRDTFQTSILPRLRETWEMVCRFVEDEEGLKRAKGERAGRRRGGRK